MGEDRKVPGLQTAVNERRLGITVNPAATWSRKEAVPARRIYGTAFDCGRR
jgi:hypothetical protein